MRRREDDTGNKATEQYMMYSKAVCFGDDRAAARILAADEAAEIKALGRLVSGYDESLWNGIRQIIVYEELLAKFSQNAELKELSALFKRLYEDNVFGRVTKEQFRMLSESCNGEQRTFADKLTVLTDEIEQQKSAANNVDRFVAFARKYTDIQELTPEVLRTFVSKIVVHEQSEKRSKHAEQRIDIHFTNIGTLGK